MSAKFDLAGFEYKNGNKVTFDGKFGKVELVYFSAQKSFDVFENKDVVIDSCFCAYLIAENGKSICNAEATGEQEALIRMYQEYAKFCALEDCGAI